MCSLDILRDLGFYKLTMHCKMHNPADACALGFDATELVASELAGESAPRRLCRCCR
jgi:hypothetical protein